MLNEDFSVCVLGRSVVGYSEIRNVFKGCAACVFLFKVLPSGRLVFFVRFLTGLFLISILFTALEAVNMPELISRLTNESSTSIWEWTVLKSYRSKGFGAYRGRGV